MAAIPINYGINSNFYFSMNEKNKKTLVVKLADQILQFPLKSKPPRLNFFSKNWTEINLDSFDKPKAYINAAEMAKTLGLSKKTVKKACFLGNWTELLVKKQMESLSDKEASSASSSAVPIRAEPSPDVLAAADPNIVSSKAETMKTLFPFLKGSDTEVEKLCLYIEERKAGWIAGKQDRYISPKTSSFRQKFYIKYNAESEKIFVYFKDKQWGDAPSLGQGGEAKARSAFNYEENTLAVIRTPYTETAIEMMSDPEAEAIRNFQKIEQAGVVRLIDSGTHEGSVKCQDGRTQRVLKPEEVFEYYNLGDLYKAFYDGKISIEEIVMEAVPQLLEGLKAIHDAGLVHRDLKMENILVRKDPESDKFNFAIADFSFAVFYQNLTIEGDFRGTIDTASPEKCFTWCLIKKSPSPAVAEKFKKDLAALTNPALDVWAMGCIFHELFFRRAPHWYAMEAIEPMKYVEAIAALYIQPEAFPEPSEQFESISLFIWKMLQVKPENRLNYTDLITEYNSAFEKTYKKSNNILN